MSDKTTFTASTPREAAILRYFFKEQSSDYQESSVPSKNGKTVVRFVCEETDKEMFELISMEIEERLERDGEFRSEFEDVELEYKEKYW